MNWQEFGEKMIELRKDENCDSCPDLVAAVCRGLDENLCEYIVLAAKAMGVEGV